MAAIVNISGASVATHSYDAWGNVLTTTGSMASTLGETNPLRYRGYVYDEETGLYYLQSRYYDPEMGRFINADAFASTGQGLLGHNMFIYCNNNSIVLADSSGCAAKICISDEVDMMYVPWKNAGGGGGIRFHYTPKNNYYTPDLSFLKKTAAVISALYNGLEISVGVGLGYYGSCDVIDFVGVEGGISGDLLVLKLQDGSFIAGQEFTAGLKATMFFYNLGYEESAFNQIGEVVEVVPTVGVWSDDSWTIVSGGVYFIAGGSFRIGFDTVGFCEDLDEIVYGE